MQETGTVFHAMLDEALDALGATAAGDGDVRVSGGESWRARYPVTDLACASMAAAALMVARWISPADTPLVTLDRRLASLWFGFSLQPEGWRLPDVRNPVTGDYRTRDGWIRIHANAAHHRRRALGVLGLPDAADHAAVAECVHRWSSEALEAALVAESACGAALRRPEDWEKHPQGLAVAEEPLIDWTMGPQSPPWPGTVSSGRPLAGIRVLDLTRVLAGPVATRFLAAYGADVLRLDPVDWDEPGMVPEVTVGKRCASLDLHWAADRAVFEDLLSNADVLVHGYRPGALEDLGYGADVRAALCPGLVDVSLDAWGWKGPWRGRRGFDSLVQMSTGIAWPSASGKAPHPLPVQALDQATGYLMAAAAMRGLILCRDHGKGSQWRVSLARTARWLTRARDGWEAVRECGHALDPAGADDRNPALERTPWGPARRLRSPCHIGDVGWSWDRPPADLRSGPPAWVPSA